MATLSYSVDTYAEQLIWIADLYIERGYPAKVVLGWVKRFKSDAWIHRLREKTSGESNKDSKEESSGIFPLLSIMNPVWEYVVLSDVHDAMVEHLIDLMVNPTVIRMSMKRLVASLKRPRNLTDFSNAHNNRINGKSKDTDVLQVTGYIEPAPAEDRAEYAPANLDDHDWQDYWNIVNDNATGDSDMDIEE